jgi:hypothetical protein
MRLPGQLGHLTYCTNIHAGEAWEDVFSSLRQHLPSIKQSVSPVNPLGIGLRLSGRAAYELQGQGREGMKTFKAFLDEGDYYIFTLNGFPYGTFHGQPVKEGAYKPDWTSNERLKYTDLLADLLAQWLPDGMEGSISTVPGTFKAWASGSHRQSVIETMTINLIRHVAHLVDLKRRTGKTINLALEPEPFCFIETIEETIAFFNQHLFSAHSVELLSKIAEFTSAEEAESALRTHLGVCYDICHAAVEFEDPAASIDQLHDANVRITKLQISSAVKIPVMRSEDRKIIGSMDEPTYMHQVIENTGDVINRYSDIPEALEKSVACDGAEWRIHFHVPIFQDEMRNLGTTQDFLKKILSIHAAQPICEHLEVETYTWDVLPEIYRKGGIDKAIARELNWVKEQLGC